MTNDIAALPANATYILGIWAIYFVLKAVHPAWLAVAKVDMACIA